MERAKEDLALKPDFNVYDAFKIFDLRDQGYIGYLDLKQGLNSIGIFALNTELDLFITRYDQNKDGKLRFSEFVNAVMPVDTYYATILNRRNSNFSRVREDCFSYSTRLQFKELMKTHFSVERLAETLRKSLNHDPSFDVYEAFKAIDVNKDGIITKNEIKKVFEGRGFFVTEMEVAALMERMDKDKDGRISYYEFVEEIKPKTY